MTALSRPFFGWRVVGAAFVLAVFAWGTSFYGPPILLQVLHASRGWPVSVVSGAITAHFLLGAAVVANLAALLNPTAWVRPTSLWPALPGTCPSTTTGKLSGSY